MVIGPVDFGLRILNTASGLVTIDVERRPFRAALLQRDLLAEMSATVFSAEPGPRLTDEAIAPDIDIIVAVIVSV